MNYGRADAQTSLGIKVPRRATFKVAAPLMRQPGGPEALRTVASTSSTPIDLTSSAGFRGLALLTEVATCLPRSQQSRRSPEPGSTYSPPFPPTKKSLAASTSRGPWASSARPLNARCAQASSLEPTKTRGPGASEGSTSPRTSSPGPRGGLCEARGRSVRAARRTPKQDRRSTRSSVVSTACSDRQETGGVKSCSRRPVARRGRSA